MPSWASRLIPDDHDAEAPHSDPLSSPPVVIVDGHYITFRSFHGMPSLTTSDGTPVGALVGFCNVINKLVSTVTIAVSCLASDSFILVIKDVSSVSRVSHVSYHSSATVPTEGRVFWSEIRDERVLHGKGDSKVRSY